ncbi:MAG: flagellar motor switch protein FliM [Planctomycetota bacterium]|nr:flagellar motor switch protein FliM [Planctomycetota bacterium]
MTDVLDQSEVDALLAAVDSGEVQDEESPVAIFSRQRKDLTGVEVRPYDFKRPERVSKDQMRALETLHEAFARNFGASLSGFLRTIVEVKVAMCDQMTYSEFIASLPNPTSFNLLTAAPLEGNICLEISPLIVYPIIDRLLGGTNAELFIPQRPLTVIEQRLINKVTQRAVDALREAWEGVKELDLQLTDSESNPHLVQIVPPNEVVVVIGFELKMSSRAGTMNLCIPYNVIESVMDALSAQSWFSTGRVRGAPQYVEPISKKLSQAALDISAVLANTTITLRDLLNLSVGDILLTETAASEPATLFVEDEPKFIASLGRVRGQRALKVCGSVTPLEQR